MANTLYLFTGENQYELTVELNRRKENFAQKFGAETIFVYNSENWDSAAIRQSIFGGGLFVTKKLIIVEGIPQDNEASNKLKADQYEKVTEEIMHNAAVIPDDTILICVSYNPDKRGRFYKFIIKEGQVKEFKTLSGTALLSFVKQIAPELQLNDATLRAIVQKV
jgi:DNA polymerase III delta subunit